MKLKPPALKSELSPRLGRLQAGLSLPAPSPGPRHGLPQPSPASSWYREVWGPETEGPAQQDTAHLLDALFLVTKEPQVPHDLLQAPNHISQSPVITQEAAC